MKPDYQKAAENLREAIVDNSHLSGAELRKKLANEGVDVDRFLTRTNEAFRKGLQEKVRQQVAQAKLSASVRKGTVFGDLADKGRAALLALHEAATAGKYGAETLARCRNKNAEEMTDEELRSWLEDIERLNQEK